MKKRVLKTMALCLAVLMIGGIAFLGFALLGNPVSRLLVRRTATAHLKENYADTDYTIEKIVYDCKFGGDYNVYLTSESSIDGDFTLQISSLGVLERDNYESYVLGHRNVSRRLMDEYGDSIMAVMDSSAFDYEVVSSYGNLNFYDPEFISPGKIHMSELVNDKIYDVGELGRTNGTVDLYIFSDKVDYETAAKILLKAKELLSDAGIYFYSIDLVLSYPPEDPRHPESNPEGEIRFRGFLCEDIYEAGLAERIALWDEDN